MKPAKCNPCLFLSGGWNSSDKDLWEDAPRCALPRYTSYEFIFLSRNRLHRGHVNALTGLAGPGMAVILSITSCCTVCGVAKASTVSSPAEQENGLRSIAVQTTKKPPLRLHGVRLFAGGRRKNKSGPEPAFAFDGISRVNRLTAFSEQREHVVMKQSIRQYDPHKHVKVESDGVEAGA